MRRKLAGILRQRVPYDDGSVLFIVEPHLNDHGPTRIQVFTQAHTPSEVFAVALASGSTTPSKAQIKAGQNAGGTAAIAATAATDIGKGVLLNFTALTKNTVYKICTYCDNDPSTSVIHTIDLSTIGGATISDALKTLTAPVMDFSGDSVVLTGSDVDTINNQFFAPYGNTELRATSGTVINKPVFASATGPNATPVIKFNGTSRPAVSGALATPAVVDFQSFTVHLLFKAVNTTTSQCLLTNMVNPSTGTQGSKGFRVLIGSTSNQMSFQFWNMSNVNFSSTNVSFSDITNFHLITILVKSTTDGASTIQCYLDGVTVVNLTATDRVGAPIDTPITFGGFTFPSNIFPGRYDFSRCTIFQWFHTNEEVNFAWAEFNTKYALSIPLLP